MCILLILSVWGRDYPPASLSASGLIPLISITGFPSVPTVILRVASIVQAECGSAVFNGTVSVSSPCRSSSMSPLFSSSSLVDTDGLQCFPVKVFLSEYPVVILIHVFFSDEWLMILFCILFIRPVCFLFSVPAAGFACRPPVRHAGLYCGVCPGFPGSIAAVRNLRSLSGRN